MSDDYTTEDTPFTLPKFTLNMKSDGKISLTIRTDNESELEKLLNKWEPRVAVFPEEPIKAHRNGNGNGHRTQETKYFQDDDCPQCHNKLAKRNGRNGPFIGCLSYPHCNFTQKL